MQCQTTAEMAAWESIFVTPCGVLIPSMDCLVTALHGMSGLEKTALMNGMGNIFFNFLHRRFPPRKGKG